VPSRVVSVAKKDGRIKELLSIRMDGLFAGTRIMHGGMCRADEDED
jgi:hypothetical protein